MYSTHTALHPEKRLPLEARRGHVLPELAESLTSIGKLCDSDCIAIFDKGKAIVTKSATIRYKDSDVVLRGTRDHRGLWVVPMTSCEQSPAPPASRRDIRALATQTIPTAPKHANFNVYNDATIRDIIHFHHRTLFSPTKSTFLKALANNHFVGWPALSAQAVRQHLTLQTATLMGHMDQQRKNIRSTKTIPPTPEEQTADLSPPQEQRSKDCYLTIRDVPTGQIYTDQTGPFPTVSSRGVKAVMVLYDYDSNAILVEGITSRGASELLRAFKVLSQRLSDAGLQPKFHRLDNEASGAFKSFLKAQNIEFQLTPASLHRRNAAERAIRTWKNHFIAGLSSVDPTFPLRLWCQLIPQSEISLNLLRQSRLNPKLSAYAQLFGLFDYNSTPLGPPGCKVVVFDRPENRGSWDNHGEINFYVAPALEHYRCFITANPSTGRNRVAETIEFFPHNFRMPQLSSLDIAGKAALQLLECLKKPQPSSPLLPPMLQYHADLVKLAEIFQTSLPQELQRFQQQQSSIIADAPLDTPVTNTPRVDVIPSDDSEAALSLTSGPPTEASAPRVRLPSTGQPKNRSHAVPRVLDAIPVPQANVADITLSEPATPFVQHWCNGVFDAESGKTLEYRQLLRHPKYKLKWNRSAANEFGRLAQGIGNRIEGTNTIRFIPKHQVPANKKCTYLRFVCEMRPQKEEQERTRATVGGNLIDYPGETSTSNADITTYKLHINDVISTPGARCVNWDISNFYLGTPLPSPEYARIHLSEIPEEVILEYNLRDIADERGYVYIRIDKGMYGLPQAGRLANDLLRKRLAEINYFPVRHTPGLWKHVSNGTSFVLVVDDFSVKYVDLLAAKDLLAFLRKTYKIKVDWEASLFCGITTKWHYDSPRSVTISMPGYIESFLQRIGHPLPKRAQHSPYPAAPIQYGAKSQLAPTEDKTPLLSPADKTFILQVVGTLLFYSRAVDPILGPALSSLASEQSKSTTQTMRKTHQLLDFCATYPNTEITYYPSDMILDVHSDASYNSEPGARSRSGGHFSLVNGPHKPTLHNGPILVPSHIIKHVASSAADAEIGSTFINCKEALPIRTTLAELGYVQPRTKVTLDNTTAEGFLNDTIKKNRTKAIDMRYYWLLDRQAQDQFEFIWKPAALNKADYPSKHHPASHHIKQRPLYVANAITSESVISPQTSHQHQYLKPLSRSLQLLRGCVDPQSLQHPDIR